MINVRMTILRALKKYPAIALILLSNAVFANPDAIKAVPHYDLTKCLGIWYEIARTDHLLEKNLDFTSADFFIDRNGSINVSTRGLDKTTNKWKQVEARVQETPVRQDGDLDLLFFGMISTKLTVLAVDDSYRHALLASRNMKNIWLLSREQTLPESIIDFYLDIAQSNLIETDNLVWVVQKE